MNKWKRQRRAGLPETCRVKEKAGVGDSCPTLTILLLIASSFVLSSCFAPRYVWTYLLPDKSYATVNMRGYEVVLSITAPKKYQEYERNVRPGFIRYSLAFETFYRDSVPEPSVIDSIPNIKIDSAYLIQPPKTEIEILKLYRRHQYALDTMKLYKLGKDWIGYEFSRAIDIDEDQKKLVIGFRATVMKPVSDEIIESEKYEFELTQFYDRYWILMQ